MTMNISGPTPIPTGIPATPVPAGAAATVVATPAAVAAPPVKVGPDANHTANNTPAKPVDAFDLASDDFQKTMCTETITKLSNFQASDPPGTKAAKVASMMKAWTELGGQAGAPAALTAKVSQYLDQLYKGADAGATARELKNHAPEVEKLFTPARHAEFISALHMQTIEANSAPSPTDTPQQKADKIGDMMKAWHDLGGQAGAPAALTAKVSQYLDHAWASPDAGKVAALLHERSPAAVKMFTGPEVTPNRQAQFQALLATAHPATPALASAAPPASPISLAAHETTVANRATSVAEALLTQAKAEKAASGAVSPATLQKLKAAAALPAEVRAAKTDADIVAIDKQLDGMQAH